MNIFQRICSGFGRQYIFSYDNNGTWGVQRCYKFHGHWYTKKAANRFEKIDYEKMGEKWEPLTRHINAWVVMTRDA